MVNLEIITIRKQWNLVNLKEKTTKIGSGITPRGGEKVYKKEGRPFIRSQNVGWGNLILNDIAFIDEKTHIRFNSTEIKNDDVLLNITGASIGRSAIADSRVEKGNVNQHVCIIRTDPQQLIPYYLSNFLLSKTGQQQIGMFQAGGNREGLNFGQIGSIQILFPVDIKEQEKICFALSNINQFINILEKLLQKKKNIKKGTMQELLTGKRRLQGFKEKWELKEFKKIVEIKKGQMITEKISKTGNIPVIGGGKTSSYFHNKPNRFHKTITISSSGANAGHILFHKKPIFASDCSTIEEGEEYSIEFIFFHLQRLQNKIYYLQSGGAQPHIHAKDINPLKIPIPKNKEEQSTIANILSDMDSEIKELEEKRDKYIMIKDGMMQKLLTGEIRLT